ncbi:MAG: hypothetical protein PHD15_01650 [Clostridia bacterium]|nr:hypothetical protein [Clostridia bacterium]MDD4386455.1 hypothetical protein [Clostridia bacterium]
MNIMKKIFKTLFILAIIINAIKVYGYGLVYQCQDFSLNGTGYAAVITQMVQASPRLYSKI